MKKIVFILLVSIGFIFYSEKSFCQIALNFNGSSNYVSTNGSPVLNNQSRTVDAWIKTTNTITTQKVICDWGATTPNGSRFTLNTINNKLRIEVGGVGFTGTTSINTGQWVHVSATYNSTVTSGNNVFLYINGLLEAAGSFTGYPTLTTTTTVGFRIGLRVDGVNFFEGNIDEVKVYNYARTQSEIAADTLEYCAPQPGLVAYYKLNEGIPNGTNTSSTVAIDYSGLGNHGTLNSFSLTGTSSNWVTGRVRSVAPTISISPNANICAGSSVSLTTNAVNNYTWSNGNSSSTLITVSPTITTTYSISTTNVYNCVAAVSITVSNGAPTVTVNTAQNPICTGATTSFSATGAVTYTWTGGITNNQPFTPASTNSYSLAAGNACGIVNSVHTITVIPLPVTAIASPTLVCEGYTCNLTAASPSVASYTWSPSQQSGASIVVIPSTTSIYTVTASDGTCVGTQTVQVATKTTPSITINNTLVTVCEGQSTSLTANGAGSNGSYSWSPEGGNGSNTTITPSVTGLYSVIGTNSLGCSSSVQIPVVVLLKPVFSVAASNTLVCSGQTVTLNANGASTYTWSTGATTASTSVSPTSSINAYSVTATASSNSCTATNTVTIVVITPNINYSSSLSICHGENATLTASGASTYSWNGISTGSTGQQIFSPLTTSTYTLAANTQSMGLNCLSLHVATVIVNPTPTIMAVASKTTNICIGNSNTLTASGASTYTWSGVGINSNALQIIVTPTITTSYTLNGKSSEGCEATTQVQVKVSACIGIAENLEMLKYSVYPNPSSTEIFISSVKKITLELYASNGQLVKTIQVTEGVTNINISSLSKGIYLLKNQGDSFLSSQKLIIE